MRAEFLERVGVRQNAAVGLLLGLFVGGLGLYMAYLSREGLRFPFPLYAGLALVAVAVTAMFVTIVATLLRWWLQARREAD